MPTRVAPLRVLTILVAAVCVAPSASAAATWSEKAAAGSKESAVGVSCSSEKCSAVGAYHGPGSKFSPLAERGGEAGGKFFWESEGEFVPVAGGTTEAKLLSVSCTSASACIGVGYRTYEESSKNKFETIAESWNGTKWSIQTTPKTEDSFLEGVSCSAANACTAVGRQELKTLAERWNGTEWSTQTTPNPTAEGSKLDSVSCSSAEACTAAGESHNGGEKKTLAESWNGKEWTIQTTPNPEKTSGGSYFHGISCTSSTACTAVGETINLGTQTLAERWNGTQWSIQKTPATEALLDSVSCTSATTCIAVGMANLKTLAESWNGTEWTTQTTPNPTGSTYNELTSLSCTSSTICTAVGLSRESNNETLVEHYS